MDWAALLYALLTGKAPFGGDSVMDNLDQVRERPPEHPGRLNANVPRDLEVICLKCLEKAPARRYSSAQAVADDLHRYLTAGLLHWEMMACSRSGISRRFKRHCRFRPILETESGWPSGPTAVRSQRRTPREAFSFGMRQRSRSVLMVRVETH